MIETRSGLLNKVNKAEWGSESTGQGLCKEGEREE